MNIKRKRKLRKIAPVQGLDVRQYQHKMCDNGMVIKSCWADQYGRVLQTYINSKNQIDLMPTGLCIALNS